MVILWIVAVRIGYSRWRKTYRLRTDLQGGAVNMACGKAQPSWNPVSLSMRIEDVWLDLSRHEFDVLRQMESVCIYYLRESRFVLSVRQTASDVIPADT